jgi:hypothetical protein
MAQGYEIRSHQYLGTEIRVLAREGSKDFLEKMHDDPRQCQKLKLIVNLIEKICERGVRKCIGRSNFIRMLDEEVGLAELKYRGSAIRAMVYVDQAGEMSIVLLFDFKGHGGSDRIQPGKMSKGRSLARIARDCMEEE